MTNTVNKPSHYIGVNGMEVEEVLQNFLPKIKDGYVAHRVGSAIEYLLRHPEKNGDEDILKAIQNIKQIADYNLDIKERKKVALEDSQQESVGQKIIKEIEGSLQGTVDGNEMNEFLKALANTDKKPEWTEYLVPNSKVSTFYGGTNLND